MPLIGVVYQMTSASVCTAHVIYHIFPTQTQVWTDVLCFEIKGEFWIL